MHQAKTSQPTQSSRNLEDTLNSPSHLFLNKPISRKSSSVSVNESGPPPTLSTGIRAQIGHLLPRHANFRARIQIHQISSVPFVSGEFGVRWKFKGVQSSPTPKKGLLGRVTGKAKGKGKASDGEPLAATGDHDDVVHPVVPILTNATHKAAPEPTPSRPPTDHSTSDISETHSSSYFYSSNSSLTIPTQPSLHWADSYSSSTSHIFNSASANSSHVTMVPDSNLTESPDSSPIASSSAVSISYTLRRGMTPFLKLKDHAVIWSHTLDTLLKFDIDRETHRIQPHPLKLVVMQRVIPDDPDGSPQNPRLGAVYLNLAEYIGKGSVERKYLLKESKTNAILKLTVELEHVSGETNYIAPLLPKGEISNEITRFLADGAIRKKPRALNLFGPYRDQKELENDLLGTAGSGRFPKSARSQRGFDRKPSDGSTTILESDSEEGPDDTGDLGVEELAFDIQRLPHAYGTKTTETIIEALFNPVKITDTKYESPFTMYEPIKPGFVLETAKKSKNGIGLGLSGVGVDHDVTTSRRQNSLKQDAPSSFYHYSTGSSSTSLHTTTTSSSYKAQSKGSGGYNLESQPGTAIARCIPGDDTGDLRATTTTTTLGGVKGWWKRHTTRPGSPMTARVLDD